MSNENDPTLDEVLRVFVTAALCAYSAAQREYREQRPEEHAALCELIERGGLPHISVTLGPEPAVHVGLVQGERCDVFFSWPAPKNAKPN